MIKSNDKLLKLQHLFYNDLSVNKGYGLFIVPIQILCKSVQNFAALRAPLYNFTSQYLNPSTNPLRNYFKSRPNIVS